MIAALAKQEKWVKLGDFSYVKKLQENIFEVCRIVEGEDFYYVEFYDKVDIKKVSKKEFSRYGGYDDFITADNEYDKALLVSLFALSYDSSLTCNTLEEVKDVLIEENILDKTDVFSIINSVMENK